MPHHPRKRQSEAIRAIVMEDSPATYRKRPLRASSLPRRPLPTETVEGQGEGAKRSRRGIEKVKESETVKERERNGHRRRFRGGESDTTGESKRPT